MALFHGSIEITRYLIVFDGIQPLQCPINFLELHRRLLEGFWSFPVNLMQIVRWNMIQDVWINSMLLSKMTDSRPSELVQFTGKSF